MQIEENYPLKKLNTFGIDASARYFSSFDQLPQLETLLAYHVQQSYPLLVLGGGSNLLLTKNYEGLVLKNSIKGVEKIKEDNDHVYIRAGAGENWHEFVLHCIANGWAGVENLSLIPGCVGASPMQNIGAYGVEIKDVFHSLTALHRKDLSYTEFSNSDCAFGYRESVFKRKYKDQFVITSVSFRLRKQPVFNTSYGAIEQELDKMGVAELSIKAISDAVIRIRSSKLPDPRQIGNAGSFFKNPSIANPAFLLLKEKYPGIVGYANADGTVKLAAGWLIEQCGWKGYREGDAGVHALQALVLVNYGNAGGEQVYTLSSRIVQSVQEKFNVTLEREVNIV